MLSVLATGAVGQVRPFEEKQLRAQSCADTRLDFAADGVRFIHLI